MIEKFKYICLDLWGTLFIETPKYKNKLFEIKYNVFKKYFPEIKLNEFKQAIKKDKSNARQESKDGYNLNYPRRIQRILQFLHINKSLDFCQTIYLEIDSLICEITPDINVELLEHIKRNNKKIILCSNTGFTSSKTIRFLLHKLGIDSFFHKMYFSDELGFTKSNKQFYKHVVEQENDYTQDFLVVGDNINYDIKVPNSLGMTGILVNEFLDELNLNYIKNNYLKNCNYELLSVVYHKNIVFKDKDRNIVLKFFKRLPNGKDRFDRELEFYELAQKHNIKQPKMLKIRKFKNNIFYALIEYEFIQMDSAKKILREKYHQLKEEEFLDCLKQNCDNMFNLLESYFKINQHIEKIKFSNYDRSLYMYKTPLSTYCARLYKLVPYLKDKIDDLNDLYSKLSSQKAEVIVGLTNGDFSLRDVLIGDETMAIDWEHYRYAPVESDIAGILCSLFNSFYKVKNIDEILIKLIKKHFNNINYCLLLYFCLNRFITVACSDYKIIENDNYDFYLKFFNKLLGGVYETI